MAIMALMALMAKTSVLIKSTSMQDFNTNLLTQEFSAICEGTILLTLC